MPTEREVWLAFIVTTVTVLTHQHSLYRIYTVEDTQYYSLAIDIARYGVFRTRTVVDKSQSIKYILANNT